MHTKFMHVQECLGLMLWHYKQEQFEKWNFKNWISLTTWYLIAKYTWSKQRTISMDIVHECTYLQQERLYIPLQLQTVLCTTPQPPARAHQLAGKPAQHTPQNTHIRRVNWNIPVGHMNKLPLVCTSQFSCLHASLYGVDIGFNRISLTGQLSQYCDIN